MEKASKVSLRPLSNQAHHSFIRGETEDPIRVYAPRALLLYKVWQRERLSQQPDSVEGLGASLRI